MSFRRETNVGMMKCRLFFQAVTMVMIRAVVLVYSVGTVELQYVVI